MVEEMLVGLFRAIIAASAAVAFGKLTAPVMHSSTVSPSLRLALILLCSIPIFAPTLLTGYAYARWSLTLIHHPWLKEIAYLILLILKVAPLGALLFFLFPPALGDTARHCMHLARRSSVVALPWRSRVEAFADTSGITFIAAMLLAFHEFEIASLTGVDAWTVRLFDAHAGGVPWTEAVSTAAAPIGLQLILVAVLVWRFCRRRSLMISGNVDVTRPLMKRRVFATWGVVAIASGIVVFLPAVLISKEAAAGLVQLADSFALHKEITSSALLALCAGFAAFAVSGRLSPRLLGIVAIPGLCGPLIVAMGSIRVFQFESLQVFYDSPIPLIGVLVVLLLPFAFLIQTLRRKQLASGSTYVAARSGAWFPRWTMAGRINFCMVLLFFLLAYSELVASAILAPPGMTTAPARLYNLMHYGQTAVLSAMVLAAFLAPLLVSCVVFASVEWIVRFRRT